jgi:hypothetical protein
VNIGRSAIPPKAIVTVLLRRIQTRFGAPAILARMPAATPDDYHTPWKSALTRYFPQFLLYYFPDIHAALDWSAPPLAFLGAELAQLGQAACLRPIHNHR